LDSGKEYSRKVPLPIIDGVVLSCEWTVGELIGPKFDVVGVNESPQAAISNARRSKIGRYLIRFMGISPGIVSWLITNLFL
jgi:hypothetical protein